MIDDANTSSATATPVSRCSAWISTVGCASGHSDPRHSGTSVQASAAPEWRTRPPSTIWKKIATAATSASRATDAFGTARASVGAGRDRTAT